MTSSHSLKLACIPRYRVLDSLSFALQLFMFRIVRSLCAINSSSTDGKQPRLEYSSTRAVKRCNRPSNFLMNLRILLAMYISIRADFFSSVLNVCMLKNLESCE